MSNLKAIKSGHFSMIPPDQMMIIINKINKIGEKMSADSKMKNRVIREKILELCANHTAIEIAEILGCSPCHVRVVASRSGVEYRPCLASVRAKHTLAEVLRLARTYKTTSEIAETLGISRCTVRAICRKRGVVISLPQRGGPKKKLKKQQPSKKTPKNYPVNYGETTCMELRKAGYIPVHAEFVTKTHDSIRLTGRFIVGALIIETLDALKDFAAELKR